MNRRRIIMTVTLGLILIFPLPSFSSTDTGATVTKRGTINDDYYAAAGTVNIDATIGDDLFAAGGQLMSHREHP